MTDSRRDFLLRFAAIALAGAAAGCESAAPMRPDHNVVYGPPPFNPQVGLQDDFVAVAGDRVLFDVNKHSLRADAKATLDRQIAWLKKYPSYSIVIEGHADERGTREYNLALGERRAAAVKAYMIANGIPASRLATVSYGKERPLALGANEAAWVRNRRAVSVLGK